MHRTVNRRIWREGTDPHPHLPQRQLAPIQVGQVDPKQSKSPLDRVLVVYEEVDEEAEFPEPPNPIAPDRASPNSSSSSTVGSISNSASS